MRICVRCSILKGEDQFNWKNKKLGIKQKYCKFCQKKWKDAHYVNNKKYYYEKNKVLRKKKKEWWNELKSKLICEICGEDHPATIDFHHSDPSKKDFTISKKFAWYGKSKILEEIKKCQILCSNCHRKLHWNEKMLLSSSGPGYTPFKCDDAGSNPASSTNTNTNTRNKT